MSSLPLELDPSDRGLPTDRNVFEIGLVLAGSVSAGSYIGGVLDFLIEALDAWEAARTADASSVPSHRVVIRVISGASGGAMNAALFAHVIDQPFTHLAAADLQSYGPTSSPKNPFFDAWVDGIDIREFLRTDDLADPSSPLYSLFNCTVLDRVAAGVFLPTTKATPIRRPWTANPLRVLLTTGNLRGVPYGINLTGSGGIAGKHGMLVHGDHTRFAREVAHGAADYPGRVDEIPLSAVRPAGDARWSQLVQTALGSGAFPLALKARELNQVYSNYDGRQWTVDASKGTATPIAPDAIAGLPANGLYRYLAVDGGIINNEPLELARRVLAGALGRNPREGHAACRAVLLIDPFPAAPDPGPEGWTPNNPAIPGAPTRSLFSVAGSLINAWVNQSRFKAEDLQLAQSETIYSRFLIAPSRGKDAEISGGRHLAGGALGGFGGFIHREYRLHDYLLGRRNAEQFFRQHFVLPIANPLFGGWREDSEMVGRFEVTEATRPGEQWLPIVPVLTPPLLKNGQQRNPCPAWPTQLHPFADLKKPFGTRCDRIYDRAIAPLAPTWIVRQLLKTGRCFLRDWLWTKIKKAGEGELKRFGL